MLEFGKSLKIVTVTTPLTNFLDNMDSNICFPFSKSSGQCFKDYRLQTFPFDKEYEQLNEIEDIISMINRFKNLKDHLWTLNTFYNIQNQENGKLILQNFFSTLQSADSLLNYYKSIVKRFMDNDYLSVLSQKDIYQYLSLIFSKFILSEYELLDQNQFLLDSNQILVLFERSKLERAILPKSIGLFLNLMMLHFQYYELSRWKEEFSLNGTLVDYSSQYKAYFDSIYGSFHLLDCPNFDLNDDTFIQWNQCKNNGLLNLSFTSLVINDENISFGVFKIPNFDSNVFKERFIDFELILKQVPKFPEYKRREKIYNPLIYLERNRTNEFQCLPGFYGVNCNICPVGTWSNDGYLHLCSNAPLEISNYINQGQTTPNCDFICTQKEHYRDGNNCVEPPIGKYPKTKENGIQSLDNCISNYPNWIRWTSPGYFSNSSSCSFELTSLMKLETVLNNITSISFSMNLLISSTSMGIIEIVDFGDLKFIGEITNGSMKLVLIDQIQNIISKSDSFKIQNDFTSLGFQYNPNYLLFYYDNIVGIDYIKLSIFNTDKIYIGLNGKLPFKIKDISISKDIHSLEYFNLVNSPKCSNESIFQNDGCFRKCNGTIMEDGSCLCSFGMYYFNQKCIPCPNNTIGSNFPRRSIKDCICEKGKSMYTNGTCIISKESLGRPDISIKSNNTSFNESYFIGSILNISHNYSFDIFYQIRIWNNEKLIYTLYEKEYFYNFTLIGNYIVTCSLEEDGRNPGNVNTLKFKIINQLEIPNIFPNQGILENPTLLKIENVENVYYSLDNSSPIRKYKNDSKIFIKPGDVLKILVKSDDEFTLSNQKEYYYLPISTSSFYQNPNQIPVNFIKDFCENDLETCIGIFTFISVISFLPFIVLLFLIICLLCKKKRKKCKICKFRKIEFKCIDCNQSFCKKCCVKNHIKEDHFIIGKDNLYIVLYPFQGENKNELTIEKDEIIKVIKCLGNENGWIFGMNSKRSVGYFPKNYVLKKGLI